MSRKPGRPRRSNDLRQCRYVGNTPTGSTTVPLRYVPMQLAMRCLTACIVLSCALIALGGCGANSTPSASGAVARIGSRQIAISTLNHWTSVQVALAPGQPNRGRSVAAQRALGLLLSSEWTLQEASELGINPNVAEVRHQLELFKVRAYRRTLLQASHSQSDNRRTSPKPESSEPGSALGNEARNSRIAALTDARQPG